MIGLSIVDYNRLGNHLKGLENKMKTSSGSSLSRGNVKDSSKAPVKGKGNGTASRGANERSKGTKTAVSKGGEGAMASGDRGRVGSSEGKSKVSGSKVRLIFPGLTLLLSVRVL